MTRWIVSAAVAAATGASALIAVAPAFAAGPRIGPNHLFDGYVNHQRPSATINMACFGPIRPGQTGHPFGGQTLSVLPSVDVPGGNTGSKANKIEVVFELPTAAANQPVTFFRYGTKPLPTSLTLPCSGSGVVSFVPLPASQTARADSVKVSFAGQP